MVHSFIILTSVVPLKPQYFESCDALQFVTGGLASLFSGTLYRRRSCNCDALAEWNTAVPIIVVVLDSAGAMVHSSTILVQQWMYLKAICKSQPFFIITTTRMGCIFIFCLLQSKKLHHLVIRMASRYYYSYYYYYYYCEFCIVNSFNGR